MREDIVSALKNAIERGFSMKDAKTSLANSGYKTEEIEEAAKYLSEFIRPQTQPRVIVPQMPTGIPEIPPEKMQKPQAPQPQMPRPQQKPEQEKTWTQPPAYQRPPIVQIEKPQTGYPQTESMQQPKQAQPSQPTQFPLLIKQPPEKPKKKTGLIVLLIILAILIGVTIFIFLAKDTVFDFFNKVIDKFS